MRLIVVLLLLLAAGVLALGVYWTTAPNSRSIAIPSAAPAKPAPDTAPQAEPQKGEVSLEITEAELTQGLNQQLAGRSLGQTPLGAVTVERIQVGLRGGRADVSGSALLGGSSVSFSALLTAAPDAEGRARVRLSDAKVASFPLPEPARAEMETAVQAELDRLLAGRRMRVRSIEIGDGRMRVIGTPA